MNKLKGLSILLDRALDAINRAQTKVDTQLLDKAIGEAYIEAHWQGMGFDDLQRVVNEWRADKKISAKDAATQINAATARVKAEGEALYPWQFPSGLPKKKRLRRA
jgi:hypothetical protein